MAYPNRRGGGAGIPGPAGVGIASSTVSYQVSSSPTTPPTQWASEPPEVPKGSYLWTKVAMNYTNNTSSAAYAVAYAGKDGLPGTPGAQGKPGTPGESGKDGASGKDGRGITSALVEYQAAQSGNVMPTGAWSPTMPTVTKGQYLWVRTTINYTDSTTSAAYSVSYLGTDGAPGSAGRDGAPGSPGTPGKDGVNGTNGSNGVGVSSSAVAYQASTSGTSAPTGIWSASVPAVTKGQYLWTRAVVTYTDGTSTTVYSVSYHGLDGSAGANGASYAPQTPVARTVTAAAPYQHTDTTKPYKVIVNARATQTVTVAGTVADRLELRIGPTAASVAQSGSGGFSLGVWESGITGIALMVGAAVQDGGQLSGDVPAGWYFQVNRLSGSAATVVSCFTQSMTA